LGLEFVCNADSYEFIICITEIHEKLHLAAELNVKYIT